MSGDRCGVCGLGHPHLQVCPFVAETELREEFVPDGRGRRRLVARIVRTRYFARPQLFEALIAAQEPDHAEVEAEAEAAEP